MLAVLNSLNAHYFPIFQLILMILVSKCMVQRPLSDITYLSLGLLSPLILCILKGILPFKMHKIISFPENLKKILGFTSKYR